MAEELDVNSLPEGEDPDKPVHIMFTNFALKKLMYRNGDKIYGNWNGSFAAACIDPFNNKYILAGSVQSLVDVGSCSNGDVVVKAEHY